MLVSCPDQPGIVAAVSAFLYENQGNIVDVDQHVDSEYGVFLMRVEWETNGFAVARDEIGSAIAPLAERFSMELVALLFGYRSAGSAVCDPRQSLSL